jgi:hypothetical protein
MITKGQKIASVTITESHAEQLDKAAKAKNFNPTASLWLAAFAIYNSNKPIKADIRNEQDFILVNNYIQKKLK